MKIYTKTGDAGETALFGGKRLPKSALRIEAYGTTDELNAWLGLTRDQLTDEARRSELRDIQNNLFDLGACLAADPDKDLPLPQIVTTDIEVLENAMDQMNEQLPALRNFVLPGGHPLVSQAHVARTVCRRAERRVVQLHQQEEVSPLILQYLNRLSDYLFVLSRMIAKEMAAEEVLWKPKK